MKLFDRVCPICGSDQHSDVVFEADFDEGQLDGFAFASRKMPEFMHFRMVRCPDCDLLYATPAPDLDWLRGKYREADFDSAVESRYAARAYARHLKEIVGRLPDRDGALDIGAGDGAFLEQLVAAGFTQVEGVEPSTAPLAQAEPEVRRLIRQGFFDGAGFEAGSRCLITCFQTLEHTDDPLGLSRAAHTILRPGGALYLVAHNYRSISARILRTRSPIYDIEHLQLHSPRSLRLMLERAGFEDISIRPLRNDYPISYWVKLSPLTLWLKGKLLTVLGGLGLGGLVLPLWPGNLMALGYKSRAVEELQ